MAALNDILDIVSALQIAVNPPEWLLQWRSVMTGEKTWGDYSFQERTCQGWLWPYLLQIETVYGSGRWDWWIQAHEMKRLPDSPIPQIDFLDRPDDETLKMLEKCLDADWNYRLYDFLDWILWGFGYGETRPKVDENVNEKWYRLFNLGLMIVNPYDYWGRLYSETKGRGSWNRSAFYPTPHPVCKMMVKMQAHDVLKENHGNKDPRALSVMEPCVGTGRMLLEASNYSVNLHGADIDAVCIKASLVNGFLYMPWAVKPAAWIDFVQGETNGQIENDQGITSVDPVSAIIAHADIPDKVEYAGESKTGVHRFKIKSGPAKKTQFKVRDLTTEKFKAAYVSAVNKRMTKIKKAA